MQPQGLLEALFGKTRRAILALLFSHTEESFHLRKILRLAGISPGAGQRELKRLSDAGIVLRAVKENQVLFQANAQCPIFDELKSLITKTAGVVDVLRAALEPLAGRISMALLYGSLARGRAGAESDIDLLVVGEVSFEDVVENVARAQDSLRREINPLVMSLEEFRGRISKGDHLLDTIQKSLFIPVIGDPHELGRLAQKRLAH
jgi:predicted nucleotidyltransferase